ncbi:ring finger domain protein [Neofusicoccum parvum]|uniref:Putative ring finger domain protein n=1 Tax=Botryosphaeria parva (strain UCR-NP2) TaxID=1287680 RepID=R1GD61_BOTPV|nr:putative ring finger domain protein [Neofusicoccum parvum UCRNP2]GME58313.1 ring finger domain protein [Neofusicoccum parvum]
MARSRRNGRLTSSAAQIRYHLMHPQVPRPLRFSRLRALRHWTIHRAWMLFKRKQRREQELELERQYNAMRAACETLRLMDERGMPGPETAKNVGRLFRTSMIKEGTWDGVPIEYARPQVDTPSRDGWSHDWKR